jgi:hypothetical protein
MIIWRLVLATKVALVMVVHVMVALSVVVVVAIATAWLAIFGVVAALLVGVLGLVAMDVTRFTRELRRGLLLGLVVFVVTVTRRFIATIAIATAWGTAFVGHVPHFVVVSVFDRASLSFRLFMISLLEVKL